MLDRVEQACGSESDDRALRSSVLGEVRRTVPFDWYAWVLTDPATMVGTSPIAATPDLDQLPRLVRAKYLTSVNRWTELGDSFVSLALATDGELERSLMWREVLRRHDVVDVASGVFADRFGSWAFLDLWRSSPSEPFTRAELDCLSAILPAVTEALRRTQATAFAAPTTSAEALDAPAVLLLSPDLDVRGQTLATSVQLRGLLPTPDDRSPVPACAYNVGAQLLARKAGVDDRPAQGRLHAGGGRWVTLRAARMGEPDPSTGSSIAVTIDDASQQERADLFARVHAFAPRETELLTHLSSGLDTHEIAASMHLSEHTVQDHLKGIFGKTGVRSRRALLSRVRGR